MAENNWSSLGSEKSCLGYNRDQVPEPNIADSNNGPASAHTPVQGPPHTLPAVPVRAKQAFIPRLGILKKKKKIMSFPFLLE